MRMRLTRFGTSILLGFLALAAENSPRASAAPQKRPAPELEEAERRYEIGVGLYAGGRPAAALAEFKASLNLRPNHAATRAAVLRLESETAAIPPPAAASRPSTDDPTRRGEALDRLFLVSIPRWINFDKTVGDALSRVGTVAALNGRVAQLLAERRLALARKRPFPKDKQLRALLRRVPALAGEKSFPA